MSFKKKLIEVALPLEAINRESAREKSIRHGHPSTLHLWWARRPLAACRAVLFASLVDDPSANPERFSTVASQDTERRRLFGIIEELVKWENINNQRVLETARNEIFRSCNGAPPQIYDPFCGGGSIPLEAHRLGLGVQASDLNPVPVVITKALIELPAKCSNQAPVNPEARKALMSTGWRGATGLAEDVRYYGKWMAEEAAKRIGNLYPKVRLPKDKGGTEARVIAWIWARTVSSPDPAAKGAHVPLVRSFVLSSKAGQKAWVVPVINRTTMSYVFEVKYDGAPPSSGTVSRNGAICLLTGSPIPLEHVRREGRAGRLGIKLLAIVAERGKAKTFVSPTKEHEDIAKAVTPPADAPDTDLPVEALGFSLLSLKS